MTYRLPTIAFTILLLFGVSVPLMVEPSAKNENANNQLTTTESIERAVNRLFIWQPSQLQLKQSGFALLPVIYDKMNLYHHIASHQSFFLVIEQSQYQGFSESLRSVCAEQIQQQNRILVHCVRPADNNLLAGI